MGQTEMVQELERVLEESGIDYRFERAEGVQSYRFAGGQTEYAEIKVTLTLY